MKSKLLLLGIAIVMLAAPSVFAAYPIDTVGITDTVAIELTVDTTNLTAQMELWVFSDENIIGATVGFSWGQSPNTHFTIDTAYSPTAITTAFGLGPFYYENSSRTLTNTNQRFLFGGSILFGSGLPGDASGRRLWATYNFSISQWDGWAIDGIKIDTMEFNSSSLYLFVGTGNANFIPVFKGSVEFGNPQLAVDNNPAGELPKSYSLEQNYPNPFNPSTEISFDLPKASHVKLTIYNILGQEVTTLVDRDMQGGTQTVNWNAGENASGVYFYKLTAGDFTQTRKMMLLK